jgi:ABC-type Mn2+/Zn2+ transport system ATPase subunit
MIGVHSPARAPGNDVLLKTRRLTVGHGGHPVVSDVNLVLRRGECVALIGPNGSGKTTLFRTLLGILPPLAGEIHYAGARRRPPLGYVPQRDKLDALFPLTVAEVVHMGAFRAWQPLASHADRARVAATLAAVGATGWERRVLAELSGGERQRVLIARALMSDPDLLLLDEPTTGIDAASEQAIFGEVDRCRAAGLGILMVSHDVPSLVRIASRALLIRAGRVVDVPAAELLAPERMRELLRGGTVDE